MGLDMWVDRVTKIPGGEKNRYERTRPNAYDALYIEENSRQNAYHDIMPLTLKASLCCSELDEDLLKSDYGIDKDSFICGWGLENGRYTYTFSGSGTIELEEYERAKYEKYSFGNFHIVNNKEIKYWRAEHGLQEKLYDLYHDFSIDIKRYLEDYHENPVNLEKNIADRINERCNNKVITAKDVKYIQELHEKFGTAYLETFPSDIENCGYHLMTERMAKAAGLLDEWKNLKENELLVYHEWY